MPVSHLLKLARHQRIMRNMRKLNHLRTLTKIEAYLEAVFENIFGQTLGVEAIMRAVGRALEDATLTDDTPIATLTQLRIHLHPLDFAAVRRNYPFFDRQLAAYVVEVARQQGVLISEAPSIDVQASEDQVRGRVDVHAESGSSTGISTERLEKGTTPTRERPPRDAQLLRNGTPVLSLTQNVVNIGRRADNQLVLDDPRVSRHHCQLRLKNGHYVIYDLDSTHGVFVNEDAIQEHILEHGDMISLGGVHLLYIEDDTTDNHRPLAGDTSIKPPRAS